MVPWWSCKVMESANFVVIFFCFDGKYMMPKLLYYLALLFFNFCFEVTIQSSFSQPQLAIVRRQGVYLSC